MLYSQCLLNMDALPDPARAALGQFAGRTANLNHALDKVDLPDNDALMEYEKRLLLDSNRRSDLYRIPAPGETKSDETDYLASATLQAEFRELENYLAYRRHASDISHHGGMNAVVL